MPFSIKEAVSYGWNKAKSHLWFVVGVTLAYLAVSSIPELVDEREFALWKLVFFIAAAVVTTIVQIGYMKIFLRLHDGEQPKFMDLFSYAGLFWKYLVTNIVYTLIVIGGFILLIVPGIIWAIKYGFALIYVIDTGAKPMDAIRKSGEMTNGAKWQILKFGVLIALINLAGVIALFVGLLFTIPLSVFANVWVYRKLLNKESVVVESRNETVYPPQPAQPEDTISA